MKGDIQERKVILVGDSGVGKTCIINVFINDEFRKENPTINSAQFQKTVTNSSNQDIKLSLWDTAGQEKYKALTKNFFVDANIALVCVSCEEYKDDAEVFNIDNAFIWANDVKDITPDCILYLVATKIDILEENSKEKFRSFLEEKAGDEFEQVFLTSSFTKEGIDELFTAVADQHFEDAIMPPPIPTPTPINSEQSTANRQCC